MLWLPLPQIENKLMSSQLLAKCVHYNSKADCRQETISTKAHALPNLDFPVITFSCIQENSETCCQRAMKTARGIQEVHVHIDDSAALSKDLTEPQASRKPTSNMSSASAPPVNRWSQWTQLAHLNRVFQLTVGPLEQGVPVDPVDPLDPVDPVDPVDFV